jgi:hypothetical protein
MDGMYTTSDAVKEWLSFDVERGLWGWLEVLKRAFLAVRVISCYYTVHHTTTL